MTYIIEGIEIENISDHSIEFKTIKTIYCHEEEEIKLILMNSEGYEIATFCLHTYGNLCEWTSNNKDIVIRNIPGFNIINKDTQAEDRKEWIELLNG